MPLFRIVFVLLFALASLHAFAQEPDSAKFFDDARAQVADIRKQLGVGADDEQLNEFRDAVAALAARADALASDRTPKLAALDARIAELGEAPAKGAPAEATDIAAQRNALGKERAALDAEIKRARLLAVDAQQLGGEIAEARRANFQARLTQRTATPLSPTFWSELGGNFERDIARLVALRDGLATALRDAFAPDNRSHALAGLGLGLLLIVLGRWGAERALLGLTAGRMPQGRLRRSAHAVAVVAVATLFTGGGVQVIVSGLDWHEAFSGAEMAFARALVGAVFFGSFITGLGRALLSARRPSWRLAPIDDAVAGRLRLFPLLFGVLVASSQLAKQVNTLIAASLSATILTSLVSAVLSSMLIAWGLLRTANARDAEPSEEAAPRRSLWVGLGIAALWLGVIVILLAAATGYIALANQIARQITGVGIVVATFYLLVHLVEDLSASALSSRAQWAEHALGLEPRVLDQLAVLCSGAFRVCAVLLALAAALLPLGTGPADLLARLGQAGTGLKIGQIEVTPGAVVSALAVFVFGLVAIRALQRWLREHYLPTTRLEAGMRSSVTTLLGYVGGVFVFAFALSALGLSVERIAWVASALSVGIGFGLQAIVQNFVSGLILLIERPVKVGDLVVLGDTEGDIRRINVRATEIQMADRSTMIVPNSELITKTVRNVTLANAEGRVRIRLPVPLASDARRVRDILSAALAAHAGVLKTPAPSVLLDGVEGSSIVFVAIAYVASPRQAGSVRSDLLFDMLARLRSEGIALL